MKNKTISTILFGASLLLLFSISSIKFPIKTVAIIYLLSVILTALIITAVNYSIKD